MANMIRPQLADEFDVDDIMQFLRNMRIFVTVPSGWDTACVLGTGSDGSFCYALICALLKVQKPLFDSDTIPVVILLDTENSIAYIRMVYNLKDGSDVVKEYAKKRDMFLDLQQDFLDFKGKHFMKVGT